MTMAEWACRGLMGLGPTTHAESDVPVGAHPYWAQTKSLPDLFGTHSTTNNLWLVEAKGSRRLGMRARDKGAQQLDVGALVPVPHQKVLCGTSLERRLFMMVDIEDVNGSDQSVGGPVDEDALLRDDNALLSLTRARMLIYLALASLPPSSLKVTAVGSSTQVGGRRGRGGLVRLLERDEATADLRRRVGHAATEHVIQGQDGVDMLTARLPGTDLILGMSRRLFGACQAVAAVEGQIADAISRTQDYMLAVSLGDDLMQAQVDVEWPMEVEQSDRRYEKAIAERQEQMRDARDRRQNELRGAARRGFSHGRASSWQRLVGVSPGPSLPSANEYLEAAADETYLAIERGTLDLDADAA
ncbi:hypothetical protein ACIQ9J_32245 [Streptomyces sp. NPDC094153]|uniref:hypothetical protein n=1 Tax=Streptomyces sp. NPDC094153 TaxID=3366058 RepID=UPI0037F66040